MIASDKKVDSKEPYSTTPCCKHETAERRVA